MKGRESGMPEEEYWDSFFDAAGIVELLVPGRGTFNIVEFGSGYGTFTIPVAERVSGTVYGFDIEPDLIALVQERSSRAGLKNIKLELRDFIEQGTGLSDGIAGHAMLYNILHVEDPVALLKEAYRVLSFGGTASVIHWRCDIPTPRGPSPDIRPGLEQCIEWARMAGFKQAEAVDVSAAAPYHYGLLLGRM